MTSRDECFFLALSKTEYFDLKKVVCNHGFFMMAPNRWCSETNTLQRAVRIRDDTISVFISISQPLKHHLRIVAHDIRILTSEDRQTILKQVHRMLRISENDERKIREFHEMHAEAKKKGFGRLFRSPSLFEDAVKSILLSNCWWKRALSMAESLCQLQPKLASELARNISISKRKGEVFIPRPILKGQKRKNNTQLIIMPNKRPKLFDSIVNFPTSKELAMVDEDYLMEHCNLGHRAKTILDLVRCIEDGKLNLNEFDHDPSPSYVELSKQLLKVKGIGPFTSANILMCLGFYHQIPADSETVRLVRKVHAREICTMKTIKKDVKEIYDKYEPYQCLAYWLELLDDYENKVGKLSELPYTSYQMVTGSFAQMERDGNEELKLSI